MSASESSSLFDQAIGSSTKGTTAKVEFPFGISSEETKGPEPRAARRSTSQPKGKGREALIGELLQHRQEYATAVSARIAGEMETYVRYVARKILDSVKTILIRAAQMAVFKFGIEACAITIRSLMEAMTGMSLQAPRIDTADVFYRAPGADSRTSTNDPSAPASSGSRNHWADTQQMWL